MLFTRVELKIKLYFMSRYSFTVLQFFSGFLSNVCMWRITQQSFQFTISFITHYSYFSNSQQSSFKEVNCWTHFAKSTVIFCGSVLTLHMIPLMIYQFKTKGHRIVFFHYVMTLYILGLMHIDSVIWKPCEFKLGFFLFNSKM